MRTPRYLPGVRNGAVAKRQARSKNPAKSLRALGTFSIGAGTPRSRQNSRRISSRALDRRRNEGRGARVMWMMILIGVALAAGFVFALRSQINAYRIAQAEELLKMKLDEYASQQEFLARDQQRALSADEVERAGRRNGLNHLKLDKEADQDNASVRQVVSRVPSPSLRAGQSDRPAINAPRWAPRWAPRLAPSLAPGSNKPVRPVSQAKVVRGVKTGKAAKVVKVVKLNAAPRESAATKARASVVKTRKKRVED
jgi:hypothetical protein